MANEKTAAEWRQAAADIQAEIRSNEVEIASLRATRANLESQQAQLVKQRDSYPFGSPDWLSIQNQILAIGDRLVTIDNDIGQIVTEIAQFTQDYNNALQQAQIAEQGEPGVNNNTPPVGSGATTPATDPVPTNTISKSSIAAGSDPGIPDEFGNLDEAIKAQLPADEFGDLQGAIERQQASEPVLSEDGEVALGIRRNTETGEIYYTDPPTVDEAAFDEFGNLDEAIQQQKNIDYNTQGQPVLAEDGSVAQGVAINPETGETYYTDAPFAEGSSKSIDANKTSAQAQATVQDTTQFKARQDWRVRLSLSPGATYLYKSPDGPGILAPLAATDGVIFPYTPTISVAYSANYDPAHPTHSNYKIFQYNNSAVDSITITGDFTAQDTKEANYLLAVIHFFRSVTKMFYGQDNNPKPGTPPPLCYLFGFGAFQFDAHPLAITNFTYNLPNDVDYIKANISYGNPGVNRSASNSPNNSASTAANRLGGTIGPGGTVPNPNFGANGTNTPSGSVDPTYVPTKIQIAITAVPVISRNQISNEFSLQQYATGKLMQGTKRSGGGIW